MHSASELIFFMVNLLDVEVVYATPEIQRVIRMNVPEGTTAYEAALLSGLANEFSDIDLETTPIGIFGTRIKTATTTVLHAGDRVELYRSLIADPKENRRTRAEKQKLGRS